ncbi:UNVERIFIED_CONTAM: hypothetical protein Scaly_2214100 [Sesamum calycinum]|uniref:Uncharacterized protein n=1 Tax=Sesamum calycinum TaxID=2727403 RepID=A0AAW2MRG3_9LAMI
MNWDQRMVYNVVVPHFFSMHSNPEPLGACSFVPADDIKVNPSSYGYYVSRLLNRFFDVVHATNQPLYNSCDVSQLSAVARLVNIKAENNISEKCYDQVSQWASDLLPRDHTLPSDYYNTQKLTQDLSLPVEKIHRLHASPVTTEHMTWRAYHQIEEGSICHPCDAEAWMQFNQSYPDFIVEPRNVRLILCIDGFAAHGSTGARILVGRLS